MPTPLITKCVSMFMFKKIQWAIDTGANYFNMDLKYISIINWQGHHRSLNSLHTIQTKEFLKFFIYFNIKYLNITINLNNWNDYYLLIVIIYIIIYHTYLKTQFAKNYIGFYKFITLLILGNVAKIDN